MSAWVNVFSHTEDLQIALVGNLLAQHDLEFVVLNKKDSVYQSFGEIEIHVKPEDAVKAIHIIKTELK